MRVVVPEEFISLHHLIASLLGTPLRLGIILSVVTCLSGPDDVIQDLFPLHTSAGIKYSPCRSNFGYLSPSFERSPRSTIYVIKKFPTARPSLSGKLRRRCGRHGCHEIRGIGKPGESSSSADPGTLKLRVTRGRTWARKNLDNNNIL